MDKQGLSEGIKLQRSPKKLLIPKIAVLIAILILAFIPAGCGLAPAAPIPQTAQATITSAPDGTASPTPFQPLPPTPIPSPTSPPPTETPEPTLPPSSTPTSTPTLSPADRTRYTLFVTMDYDRHFISVDQEIIYTNNTFTDLKELVLSIQPNRWPQTFFLNSMEVNGQPVSDYELEGQRLSLPLPQTLKSGQAVSVNLEYDLDLPPGNNSKVIFGTTSYQANLVDWFPFVVPFSSEAGWLLHRPLAYGEHLVYDPADFEINFRLEPPNDRIKIAASSPAEQNGEWTRYRLTNARSFAMSISSVFHIETASAGEIQINSYYYPGNEYGGKGIIPITTQALEIFSNIYGQYPYESLSVVEINYSDGMEYDGLIFLSRNFYNEYNGTLRSNLAVIGIHEIAHQWWFGLVGNDQALEPWLDEALSTYSELLFIQQVSPNTVLWWWNFRVNFFEPKGWVDISIYDGVAFRPYTNATYLRGARFLDDLRNRIGDEAFFAFLRDYAHQMSNRRASTDAFFLILRQHTNADISDLVKAYFQKPR